MTLFLAGFLALSLLPLTASTPAPKKKPGTRDGYALVRGNTWSISDTLDELNAVRSAYPGDFLWVRRSGSRFIIRNTLSG